MPNGVPVVIAESGGYPVTAVEANAPLLTVASCGGRTQQPAGGDRHSQQARGAKGRPWPKRQGRQRGQGRSRRQHQRGQRRGGGSQAGGALHCCGKHIGRRHLHVLACLRRSPRRASYRRLVRRPDGHGWRHGRHEDRLHGRGQGFARNASPHQWAIPAGPERHLNHRPSYRQLKDHAHGYRKAQTR